MATSVSTPKWQAWLIAFLFCCVLSLCVILAVQWVPTAPKLYQLSEVTTTALPPPPPPPKHQQTTANHPLQVTHSAGGPLLLETPEVSLPVVEFTPPQAASISTAAPPIEVPEVSWQGFSLAELDAVPQLLTPVSLNVSQEIKRRLPTTIQVKLHVSINEQGKVHLLNIVASPDEALAYPLQRLVERAQFSAPEKDGQAVKANFIWPLEVTLK